MNFKGSHFPKDVILMSMRWYIAYPLSYRQVEELLAERGLSVDHATINRWLVKHSPTLELEFRSTKYYPCVFTSIFDSFPAISLLMFSRCVYKIKMAIKSVL